MDFERALKKKLKLVYIFNCGWAGCGVFCIKQLRLRAGNVLLLAGLASDHHIVNLTWLSKSVWNSELKLVAFWHPKCLDFYWFGLAMWVTLYGINISLFISTVKLLGVTEWHCTDSIYLWASFYCEVIGVISNIRYFNDVFVF